MDLKNFLELDLGVGGNNEPFLIWHIGCVFTGGLRWTQLELAEKSGADVSAISNNEHGVRKILLNDNLLLKLADGLQLTSMERQGFLFSSSGVPESAIVRKESHRSKTQFDPAAFLKELGEHIGCLTVPALVTDSFCDILLANQCALEYYNTPAMMQIRLWVVTTCCGMYSMRTQRSRIAISLTNVKCRH